MSLTPASGTDAALADEILSWAGFIDSLDVQDLKSFRKLIDRCLENAPVSCSESFPAELLLMSLILAQRRIIEDLKMELAGYSRAA